MARTPMKIRMAPAHPGTVVAAELEDLGLSIARAAEYIDVRRATLSALINGKSELTPDMAARLDRAFGLSARLLLNMQAARKAFEADQLAGNLKIARFKKAA